MDTPEVAIFANKKGAIEWLLKMRSLGMVEKGVSLLEIIEYVKLHGKKTPGGFVLKLFW